MKLKPTMSVLLAAIPASLVMFYTSCGLRSSYDGGLLAAVGSEPMVLPAKIEAESFNAAIDTTTGNSGTECVSRNNSDVDVRTVEDQGGGCMVGWTTDGEILDYYIVNRSSESRLFDIDFRVASGSADAKFAVEISGKKVGEISANAAGYTLGWQNWVTRSLKGVSIEPGMKILRLKFQGESNINWLNLNATSDAVTSNLLAEAAIKRSCAGCHDYVKSGDTLNFGEIARRAANFKARLNDQVSPMPPRNVEANLTITEAEKAAIASFVSGIGDYALAAKPIASREFSSRGMNLVRDTMAEGAGHIWGMVFLPDGNILCTLKSGEVKIFNVESRKFSTVTGGPIAAQQGQGGLLDVAISSDFGDNKLVYFSYAKALGNGQFTTAMSRGRLEGLEVKELKEIFVATGSTATGEHFGGRIVADEDGSIWLAIGERNDRNNAQRLDLHLGKVLHLTADGKAHPGNPFINGGGLPEIYSYGHRNPQGMVKNPFTGEIWEMEHGPKGGDELNRVQKGVNFGWPLATYGTEYSGQYLAPSSYPGTEQPMAYYVPSIAPSGMSLYASDLMPKWKGLVISGALAMTHLNILEIKDGKRVSEDRLFAEDRLRVREVEMAPTGELWYAADSGQLFRIRPR